MRRLNFSALAYGRPVGQHFVAVSVNSPHHATTRALERAKVRFSIAGAGTCPPTMQRLKRGARAWDTERSCRRGGSGSLPASPPGSCSYQLLAPSRPRPRRKRRRQSLHRSRRQHAHPPAPAPRRSSSRRRGDRSMSRRCLTGSRSSAGNSFSSRTSPTCSRWRRSCPAWRSSTSAPAQPARRRPTSAASTPPAVRPGCYARSSRTRSAPMSATLRSTTATSSCSTSTAWRC